MDDLIFPVDARAITPELLHRLVSRHTPGAGVADARLVEIKAYGDGMVSTAARVVFDLDYTPGSPAGLPSRVVIKTARDGRPPGALYSNEVNFYERIRPGIEIETPMALGGSFDPETAAFGVILEDLRMRNARIVDVRVDHTQQQVRAVLDTLAKLHGNFWRSPRFEGDLAWVETHVSGDICDMFNDPAHPLNVHQNIKEITAAEPFKREMVQRLGVTVDDLWAQTKRMQRHQATLAPTLVHGDMHVGNTYQLPGAGGILDWQLMVRGYFMHDVGYYLVTSMQIADRRRYERELIAYYLDKLKETGVTDAPDLDAAWLEYRRQAVWNVYIGWLTCPVVNYGWEIVVQSHLRVMTAYEDLKTQEALAELDG